MSENIFDKIVAWSKARNIIGAGTEIGQAKKINEEIGELVGGLVKGKTESVIDER